MELNEATVKIVFEGDCNITETGKTGIQTKNIAIYKHTYRGIINKTDFVECLPHPILMKKEGKEFVQTDVLG